MSELLKFGCLDQEEIRAFVGDVEDAFMKLDCKRDKTQEYNKDEVQVSYSQIGRDELFSRN